MKINVALYTNRNNVKPMFWRIALVVMIVFCLFGAFRAFQSIGTRYFARDSSISNFVYSPYSFGEFSLLISRISSLGHFPALSLKISDMSATRSHLASFALAINFIVCFHFFLDGLITRHLNNRNARFTVVSVSILAALAFEKFRNRLGFFAFVTIFCYDLFEHCFLLDRKSCFGLITARTVVGSFYNNSLFGLCQEK